MQDGGVIPDTLFPRVDGMATRRTMQATISDTVQTRGSSHSTHMHSVHGRSSQWYTFEASILEQFEFVEGSSGSRRSRDASGSSGTISPRR